MAQIFRVERTKNYTVMSNHHFKNKNLTLKVGVNTISWVGNITQVKVENVSRWI